MANNKRYYWLKLKQGFFDSLIQKRVRRHECGFEFQIIYLELMLASLDSEGKLVFQHLFDNLADEISERINEPSDRVAAALSYLSEVGLIELDEESCFIPEVLDCTGSEGASAERTRRYRAGQASHCDGDVSRRNIEKEREKEGEKEAQSRNKFLNFSQREDVDYSAIQTALIKKSFEKTEGVDR